MLQFIVCVFLSCLPVTLHGAHKTSESFIVKDKKLSFPKPGYYSFDHGYWIGDHAPELSVLEFAEIIADNPDIEEIDFSTYEHKEKIDRHFISVILLLKNIRVLNLLGCGLMDTDIEMLSQLSSIRVLKISQSSTSTLTSACFDHVSKMKLLTELHIHSNMGVTDADVEKISTLSQLQVLSLNSARFNAKLTGQACEYLARLTNLTHLDLKNRHYDFSYSHLKKLSSLKHLKVLNFFNKKSYQETKGNDSVQLESLSSNLFDYLSTDWCGPIGDLLEFITFMRQEMPNLETLG